MSHNMQLYRTTENGKTEEVELQQTVELYNPVYKKVREAGINRPLSEAIQKIVVGDCWRVILEDGIERKSVTWYAGHEWPDVLADMAEKSNLYVHVNHEKCIVAIGTTLEIAEKLATSEGQVWKMVAGKSLRNNLEDWAKRAGWHLEWGLSIDYHIDYPATLIGEFYGKQGSDGVLAKVMEAYNQQEVPLRARFEEQNKVVVIEERRASQR